LIADAKQQKQDSIDTAQVGNNEPGKKTEEEPPAEQLSLF
jgi:hypothetical protein